MAASGSGLGHLLVVRTSTKEASWDTLGTPVSPVESCSTSLLLRVPLLCRHHTVRKKTWLLFIHLFITQLIDSRWHCLQRAWMIFQSYYTICIYVHAYVE